jgi:hypothetical protein
LNVFLIDYTDARDMASWKELKMPFNKLLFTSLALILLACFSAIPAQADPLTFSNLVALQNDGATHVDIYSQPGVTLLGPKVNFLVDINGIVPADPTQTLLITFTEAGNAPVTQSFQLFSGLPSTFSFLFSVTALGATPQGTNATLTVDILGSDPDFINPGTDQAQNSYTYNFKVAEPVPEPASVVLMSLGIVGLIEKRRRGRQAR